MPKNKPNKGLLKRIRITKNGRIKRSSACGGHLRSHKSGKLRRSYRKPKFAPRSEIRRLGASLFIRVTARRKDRGESCGEESQAQAT